MKNVSNQLKVGLLYLVSLGSGLMLYHYWQEEHLKLPPKFERHAAITKHIDSQGHLVAKTIPAKAEKPQHLIHVKTDVLDVSINPIGGSIVSAKLTQFNRSLSDHNKVQILSTQPDKFYTVQAGMIGDHGTHFKSQQHNYTMGKKARKLAVVLHAQNAAGVNFSKTFVFHRGDYVVDVATRVNNQSKEAWLGHYYSQIKRQEPPKEANSGMGRNTYHGMSFYQQKKPYTKLSYSDMRDRNIDLYQQGGWVAGQQHYFLTAWIGNPKQKNHIFSAYQRENDHYLLGMIGPEITVNPQESVTSTSRLYIGPEYVDKLHQLAKGLDLTIDYGWLWFISKMLMWLMVHIHQYVGNWGVSIILVTFVVKLVFFKMSNKSFKSMAKMSEIAPKVKALQEKYGDDKVQLQRETMALYSKEKINPLGGCLPLVIQLPFFIGLYWALIESIDLRQAPFFGWIQDLSVQDPYYVLPILMGISMLVQQLMTKNPAQDENQRRVMMLLPVFFTFIFIHFPAGLILYMITNNVLSVAQQEWSKRSLQQTKPSAKAKS